MYISLCTDAMNTQLNLLQPLLPHTGYAGKHAMQLALYPFLSLSNWEKQNKTNHNFSVCDRAHLLFHHLGAEAGR